MAARQTPDPLATLDRLIRASRAAGADAADAIIVSGVSAGVSYRLGKLEDVERAESTDLGLRVFVGQSVGFVSSSDISDGTLADLPGRAVAMAKLAPEDRFAGIAPRELLAATFPNLDLDDGREPATDALVEAARAVEGAAMSVKGITNSEGGSASYGRSDIALATSNGFSGRYSASSYGVGVSVLAGDGVGMERDDDFASARHIADLEGPDAVGKRAGERAVARLNPRKVKSQTVPVVYDPRAASGLLGHFASAISGASIARGVSFLKDRMHQPVFAKNIAIVDDPHRLRGLRSKPFDGEGVRNRRWNLIADGVLKTWLLDTTSARQLGLVSTGHAARGTGSPPSPSTTNLYMAPGTVTRDALLAGIAQGFYVTELMGMGVNNVTGDYSRGASGFWIENGRIAYPVSEVTIAGNLKDMFLNLAPANDLVFRYGANAPTVRIESMTVAGA